MENLIKGLWVGDAVASTGFARVNHSIIEYLPKKYEIHHLGINYNGDPHSYGHKIYPAATGMQTMARGFYDAYGIGRLEQLVNGLNPDFIFILNDAWIIDVYLEKLKQMKKADIPIITYFPVDAEEHSADWYRNFDIVRAMVVYTDFAKEVVLASGSPNIYSNKLSVIPHGMDTSIFHPIDKELARRSIFPKDQIDNYLKAFVILNANRNQPRKRIDITLWTFRDFAKDKDDVKLYLHMGMTDQGINIIEKAKYYGIDGKFIVTTLDQGVQNVPIETLNVIYNACNVGLNTSMGEGWGLTNWEHAATKALQILPDHSSISEIWKDKAMLVKADVPHMFPNANTVGKVVDLDSLVDTLNYAYWDWKDNDSVIGNAYMESAYKEITSRKYSWKTIAKQFDKVITSII
jgi:glycosyltransferase involved in cell wall biosynthesis